LKNVAFRDTYTFDLFFLCRKDSYKLFFIAQALTNPQLTKIDNLMEWILTGKVIPVSTKNVKLKANRVVFTIMEPDWK
jgi:hypothetical protein